ncbi:2-oxoisovalerate dehydrogenase subunit beta [Pigmentiphaga humi]|uniref:2-oxoisovalerate dehydrogenase subunit beta n=1 Tax=Pigmentiphaga humi TaxID=2478468 RepID=A0A3P4AZ44_9BURK|nr:alpha-ketoacid dehydrogenase subunit beta [Pigmentiphaga humi]VCU69354.1 2-oxoisovalerate dehydrogenase subunit beta [Pigmentiphaga humi]
MPEQRAITYRAAVIEALQREMRADSNVVVIGEDVGAAGGVFLQTEGLFDEFGAGRVIDTPISEPGAFGIAVGAAMAGMRPVFEVMFGDFITLVMDQLVNQAAKVHYMSNGAFRVPLVLRTTMGTGANLGPQHSQSLYAWAAHVPGLKVVLPATPADAKGLFAAAIRDDNPVLVFEDRLLYGMKDTVPEGDYVVPLGQAEIARPGSDVSIIALGRMRSHALAAADKLAGQGISAEVIDPRTLVPLDKDTLLASLRKTNRALVVDGAPRSYGVSGEIAAMLSEEGFDWLDAPVCRLGAEDIPIPMSRTLEPLVQPDADRIVAAVRALVGRDGSERR